MSRLPVIKSKMLPAGWLFLIVSGILLCCGLLLVNGALMAISSLGFMVTSGSYCLGRKNLSKLDLSIEMPERVHATKRFSLVSYLDNRKTWMNSTAVEISFQLVGETSYHSIANFTPAQSASKLKHHLSLPRRGVATSLHAKLRSSFPFFLFEHLSHHEIPKPIVVYPRLILPVEILNCGSLNDIDPQQGAQLGEALGEPRGLRMWQPGDSVKRVHWQASARSLVRGQGLRVREFDPPGFTPSSCAVLFHSHAQRGEVYRHDRFERACSLLAGTLQFLHSRQVETLLLADFLAWTPHNCTQRSEFIDCLSLVAHAQRSTTTELHELQHVINSAAQQTDQLVIISDMDPDEWSEPITHPANTLLIDIRQVRFKRRGFAKEERKKLAS